MQRYCSPPDSFKQDRRTVDRSGQDRRGCRPCGGSTPQHPAPSPAQPKAAEPAPASPELPNLPGNKANLPELWQQILGSLELPSTRMLLSQQGQLVRLDANRAVVQVAGNWMGMVQSRASLLEQAVAKALGGNRQLVLEASSSIVAPSPVVAPATPKPVTPPAIQPITPTATPATASKPTKPQTSADVEPIHPVAPLSSPPPAVPAEQRPKPEPQAPPTAATDIDRHAKTLANFFNGEVLEVDLSQESQETNKTT